MKDKPNILIFIDWYLPGKNAGGPIRSVANIVGKFSDNINFFIVTSNSDFGDDVPYPNVKINTWLKVNDAQVKYLKEAPTKEFIKQLISERDYSSVYFNSLFSKGFTLSPLKVLKSLKYSGNLILAPRGMLGAGALNIKPFKKKVFLKLSNLLGWFKGLKWHASTNQEKSEIHLHFGNKSDVVVAENLADLPKFDYELKPSKEKGSVKFIFVSRISIKKNILHFIESCKDIEANSNIELTVVGPIEDVDYWESCKTLIKKTSIKLNYKGSLTQSEVLIELSKNHFFVLPTLHENYGHVVIEALAMGCPVLLSDKTPWRGLESNKIGFDIDLDKKYDWIKAIMRMIDMDSREYLVWQKSCLNFANSKLNDQTILKKNLDLFLS